MRWIPIVLSLSIGAAAGVAPQTQGAAEPARYVLTSVDRNIETGDWQIGARDTAVAPDIPWSVRKYRLHGGKQDGVDLIVVDNGRLTITVVPTRGMGILRVVSGDLRLGWDSPVHEVVHPKYVNLEARGGLGWLEGFNEWLARCGLEWAGHPGADRFVNNVGEPAEMNLTLHGKVANIPASEVEVIVERQPRPRLRVRGRVDERAFYGPKLELWTEVSTEPGSSTFRVEDALTNRGAFDQEFQVIYHANYGPPLLGAGAILRTAAAGHPVQRTRGERRRHVCRICGTDPRVHRAGLQPSPLVRSRRAHGGDVAQCTRRPRGVDGLPCCRTSLCDALEKPDCRRRRVRHRPRARDRVSLYAARRARGWTGAEAGSRPDTAILVRCRPAHDIRRRGGRGAANRQHPEGAHDPDRSCG
jgi:hypothetical protein